MASAGRRMATVSLKMWGAAQGGISKRELCISLHLGPQQENIVFFGELKVIKMHNAYHHFRVLFYICWD